jgi:hypothetical protein
MKSVAKTLIQSEPQSRAGNGATAEVGAESGELLESQEAKSAFNNEIASTEDAGTESSMNELQALLTADVVEQRDRYRRVLAAIDTKIKNRLLIARTQGPNRSQSEGQVISDRLLGLLVPFAEAKDHNERGKVMAEMEKVRVAAEGSSDGLAVITSCLRDALLIIEEKGEVTPGTGALLVACGFYKDDQPYSGHGNTPIFPPPIEKAKSWVAEALENAWKKEMWARKREAEAEIEAAETILDIHALQRYAEAQAAASSALDQALGRLLRLQRIRSDNHGKQRRVPGRLAMDAL